MNDLKTALEDYLAVRRKLGFKLYQAGNLLHDFVNYAEQQKASYITTELALRWATQPKDTHPVWKAIRLGNVRRFAK
ncbi:MAG: integrase, partial [Gammaproteobacteria bacterium]|nr:integrase [Gammaproteobacteria bacterium]